MGFQTKPITEIDYDDLERLIRELPHVKDMPLDRWYQHPYEYVADNTSSNDTTEEQYFDILPESQAEYELIGAVSEGSTGSGALTRAALNYMATHGMLPEQALDEGCIYVRVSW